MPHMAALQTQTSLFKNRVQVFGISDFKCKKKVVFSKDTIFTAISKMNVRLSISKQVSVWRAATVSHITKLHAPVHNSLELRAIKVDFEKTLSKFIRDLKKIHRFSILRGIYRSQQFQLAGYATHGSPPNTNESVQKSGSSFWDK